MLQLDLYRKEIVDFLKTVSIKFDMLAETMTYRAYNHHGVFIDKDENNPYYLNMCGLYHPILNEPMYIWSLDQKKEILFDINLKLEHPKTASLYKMGSDEYQVLCKKYPAQAGLIKSIVYPAGHISEVIAAENWTIFNYDETLLPINERATIISALNTFVAMFKERYFVKEFKYELLYPLSLWSNFWYLVPTELFNQRIRNLRTSAVHPDHIWEYLTSEGIGDYRAVLSLKQSLFLYQNMNYLKQNQGKMSNLIILADNLLKEMSISLVHKTMRQYVPTDNPDCRKIPEVLSKLIVDYRNDASPDEIETIQDINQRMIAAGLEHEENNNSDYIDLLEKKIGTCPQDYFSTKLLELKKNTIDTRYENLLMRFVMDTFVYRVTQGNVQYRIKFLDTNLNQTVNLDCKDALALLYYASWRGYENEPFAPDYLPTEYNCRTAYSMTPSLDFPRYLHLDGFLHPLLHWVDPLMVYKEIPRETDIFEEESKFMMFMGSQFEVLVRHIRETRISGNLLFHKGISTVYDNLVVNKNIAINLSPYPTYNEWMLHTPAAAIIEAYEGLSNNEMYYRDFAGMLTHNMIPMHKYEIFAPFLSIFDRNNERYDRFKALFMQLCSYNNAYLDTYRSRYFYDFLTPVVQSLSGPNMHTSLFIPYTGWDFGFGSNFSSMISINDTSLDSDVSVSHRTEDMLLKIPQNEKFISELGGSMFFRTTPDPIDIAESHTGGNFIKIHSDEYFNVTDNNGV